MGAGGVQGSSGKFKEVQGSSSPMSAVHLALLRAINLGPINKISMPDLIKVFAETGCHNVRSYIQSGNIIFEASSELVGEVSKRVATRIHDRFGFRAPVILRTLPDIKKVVRINPFLEEKAPADKLHVLFLADLPKASAVQSLDPNRSPPNRFAARGKEVYLLFPEGFARNKLTNSYFDAKLGIQGTIRTWSTVLKLLEMMEKAESGEGRRRRLAS